MKKNTSPWKNTLVASMTSYINAGAIVAGAASLSLWEKYLGMDAGMIGLLAAFSANAGAAAIGAIIGGRLCDKYGRKQVYVHNLLVYVIGTLLIVFAHNFALLFAGYIVVGLAVGADIVSSWTIIAENAPAKDRARHCGSAQIAWALGPVIVYALSIALTPLESVGDGVLGSRLIFAHLAVIAFVIWLIRRNMPESETWLKEKELLASGAIEKPKMKDLFQGVNLKGMLLLIGVYTVWLLPAGTMGFFMPYIFENLGGIGHTGSTVLSMIIFGVSIPATYFIFMSLGDKYNRRTIYCITSCVFIAAWLGFFLPPAHITMAVLGVMVVFMGINNGSGQQAFYQLWSGEIFPARYRGSAQGILFFIARGLLTVWCYFLPVIMKYNFKIAVGLLVSFTVVSMLVGTLFAPKTQGKTLEEITKERYGEDFS
ncbi:minor myo-inositol transporter IolF [Bacteroidia bacterium]|nr:minor myo-inositol transporter IolF [Bacteroidia bacterium]GHT77492.1 minor myo-inositol transporter IolF [Bacteroidia bacterium]